MRVGVGCCVPCRCRGALFWGRVPVWSPGATPQGIVYVTPGIDNVTTSKLVCPCQGQQFPALLTDSSLSGQGGAGSPQVILVSHTPQPSAAACEEIAYQVRHTPACTRGRGLSGTRIGRGWSQRAQGRGPLLGGLLRPNGGDKQGPHRTGPGDSLC